MLGYAALTLVMMIIWWDQLVNPVGMLVGRAEAVATTLALWGLYRWRPCRLSMLIRVAGLMAWLGWWYPDTYELNRVLPNLDHLFAQAEQWTFGCQPALVLLQRYGQPVVSELLSLGYVSYYPLIITLVFFYFFRRYERFTYAVYVVMASFFIFYVVFDLLPVAGPQFYYEAVGCDLIAQGHFPDLGHYFRDHQESLPIPGWKDGPFYHLLVIAVTLQAGIAGNVNLLVVLGFVALIECSKVVVLVQRDVVITSSVLGDDAAGRAHVLRHLLYPGPLRHRRHCRTLCRHGALLPAPVALCQGLSEQPAREIAYGIPHGEEPYGQDGEKHEDDVPGMHRDGIGVDDERPLAVAERYDAKLLLNPAQ